MAKNQKAGKPTPEKEELSPTLRLAIDTAPLAVFFVANSQWGIINATGAFMVAMTLSLIITYMLAKKLSPMPVITCVFVLFFGGLTVFLDDSLFIKIKPTMVNLLFAALLFGGLAINKLFLKMCFGDIYKLAEKGWKILTLRWGCYFIFLAIVNEIVWRNFSDDFWVNFKVFGIMPLSLAFALWQLGVVNKYSLEQDEP